MADLSSQVGIALDSINRPCSPDGTCGIDPPVSAFLNIEGFRRQEGQLVYRIEYVSTPPPYGEDLYGEIHEVFLRETSKGWVHEGTVMVAEH